jgi:hypothetical protein
VLETDAVSRSEAEAGPRGRLLSFEALTKHDHLGVIATRHPFAPSWQFEPEDAFKAN